MTEFESLDLLIKGYQVSRMLGLVAELGVADKLPANGTVTHEELAAACEVQALPLLRVLRALAAFGVFGVSAEGRIGHSPRSRLLCSDAPDSLRLAARFWTEPGSWRAWGELDAALTGGIPHEAAWKVGRFDYLRSHPEAARLFDAFMAGFTDSRHEAIAAAYDFSRARTIADVGGGNGETVRHVLARYPDARGLVFDRPDVVAAIDEGARLHGRIAVEGGSFLERVPEGADIYLLVRVLHDWPDEDCLRILHNVRNAMPDGARLVIAEQLMEPDPQRGRPALYLLDVQMMAMFGQARERTRDEFAGLLARSGLELLRVIPTGSQVVLIESVKGRGAAGS